MGYIKLAVFDFDGTLFRSPEKPDWWKGGWWGNLNSLSEPCVPERPPADWWNGSVVSAAKQAINNPDVLAVLLTGRIPKFSLRLKDLLNQAGLHFDFVRLNSGGATEAFKMKAIQEILEENPSIRGVAIWEDRVNHLRMLADWVESGGRACTPHLITVSAHEGECRPPDDAPSASRVAARYKSKTKDENGNTHYEYGPRQVQNRHNQKADRIENLRGDIESLRDKVTNDLSSKDPKTYLPALAVALIDETYERVGNADSAAEGHYGVTGWLTKHLSFDGKEAILKYVGKSGVKHEKVVSKAPVVKLLKKLVKGKEKGDPILELDGFTVKSEDVNSYLKDFKITAKDIRGFRANQEMCQALRDARREGPDLPRARKERDKILKAEFKDALEEVAEIVGHEPATLRSDYLVPGLEDSFMKDGTILATFKSATKTTSEKEDEAVDALIKPSPKKKPPRNDLKERRIDLGDDDLDLGDDDLSLNFKDSAARVALAVRVAAGFLKVAIVFPTEEAKKKYLEDHPDADAASHTVEGEDDKAPAEVEGEKPEGKTPEKGDGKPKERPKSDAQIEAEADAEEEKRVQKERKELVTKAKSLGKAPALDKDTANYVDGVLNSLLGSMSADESEDFIDGITSARDADRDALAKGDAPSRKPPDKSTIDKGKEKLDSLSAEIKGLQKDLKSGRLSDDGKAKAQSDLESLQELHSKVGKEVQEDFKSYYAHEALGTAMRNPMTFIGDTSKPLGKDGAKSRVKDSLDRFRGMTAEDRSETVKTFRDAAISKQKERDSLAEKLSSGESYEGREEDQKNLESLKNTIEMLDADWRSLEISAVLEGDKNTPSRMGKNSQALVLALHKSGQDVEDMVDAGVGLRDSKPASKAVRSMMKSLKDEHMEDALQAVDPKMADTWKKLLDSGDRKKIENAKDIFAGLLTDTVLEDAGEDADEDAQKSPAKAKPSDIESPSEEGDHTEKVEKAIADVELDIPEYGESDSEKPKSKEYDPGDAGLDVPPPAQMQSRVAARFCRVWEPNLDWAPVSSLS